ncbi:MAG: GNAT family N-acetyltransferase [Candidatus Aegiribacteria sp.]|nr:GNAT family N-acetyltransferase [Candidatus Aegiribacteria sp.]MBD3294198.1 GNAT family N-acetyltransferase [Candidatus Fermentibacteria bacterium]
MDNLEYREYRKGDAASVARMWEESRQGWPSGFLGASSITAASVEREERGSGSLFTVLAVLDDRVIGYCRTSPYGGEPDASYVDLVNVVPDFHGHGIGKRLLLDAVRRTAESGRVRIDLHTWPANMQAVPLYKKTGFFWVPETSVYMQNYIPYLLRREEFSQFLDEDDWYGCFKRKLDICEDLQKTASGRLVFRYRFQRAGEEFLAEFDKNG